ncbi:hypothetical protein NLI96_g10585 [Meripilus lineatus]|uniref:Uncharacterized protein n=1 Tax=Meripilus lineatus TaxID=2056292 RepID=A0AAD5UTA9_9APHY|nr:hypothetical protein NLI96_g10585 [Physisporinus lineatus]
MSTHPSSVPANFWRAHMPQHMKPDPFAPSEISPEIQSRILAILQSSQLRFASEGTANTRLEHSSRTEAWVSKDGRNSDRTQVERLMAENEQLRVEIDELRRENATLFVRQFQTELHGRALADEIARLRRDQARFVSQPSDVLNTPGGSDSSSSPNVVPNTPVLTGAPPMTRKVQGPVFPSHYQRWPVRNIPHGTNKSYAPSPVSKSISQPQTPAPSEHRRIANESPHLLPPKPKSLVKMDHRPHSTPLTSNELRIQTANFPQPGSSSQAPPSQEHPPHLRLRSNTQPTPSKLPAIIDLTGEDDEDVPVVQLVPRKRTREHDQEMSDSLASLKARGSVSGSRSVPPVPSPPPTEAPSSASSFSNDSQVGQPTEAEILYVCLQNAYEQWKDSMNQVSCVMCKCRYDMSESWKCRPPPPTPFANGDIDALVTHCRTEHPTGWEDLRASVLESLMSA